MAKVYIKNDDKTFEIADNSNIAVLDGQCSILFACKDGICGSCLATVLQGMENLNEKTEQESATLSSLGANPNQRLLCQCIVKKGEVKIEQ